MSSGNDKNSILKSNPCKTDNPNMNFASFLIKCIDLIKIGSLSLWLPGYASNVFSAQSLFAPSLFLTYYSKWQVSSYPLCSLVSSWHPCLRRLTYRVRVVPAPFANRLHAAVRVAYGEKTSLFKGQWKDRNWWHLIADAGFINLPLLIYLSS